MSDCAGAHGCVCISYRVEVWLQAANGISKRQVNRFKTSSPTPEQPPCSQPLPPAVYIKSLQTIKHIMQVFVSAFLTVVQTPQTKPLIFSPTPDTFCSSTWQILFSTKGSAESRILAPSHMVYDNDTTTRTINEAHDSERERARKLGCKILRPSWR